MTREERRAKQRANRRIKRQAEHQQRMAECHEKVMAQAAEYDRKMFECISMKVEHGKHSDPTPYYAVLYAESRIPECDRIYVRGPKL